MSTLEKETTQEQDLKLLEEVISHVLKIRDKAMRDSEKDLSQAEKDELKTKASDSTKENILKITTTLQERIPVNLRDRILNCMTFDDSHDDYILTPERNQKESIFDYIYEQIIGTMIVGIPRLKTLSNFSREERNELLLAWKPFFHIVVPFLPTGFCLTWPLPEKPTALKKVDFSKENHTTAGNMRDFISEIPNNIKIVVYFFGLSRIQSWDANASVFELIGDDILIGYDFQNELSTTVKDFKDYLCDKNSDQKIFIKSDKGEKIHINNAYYFDNDKIELYIGY